MSIKVSGMKSKLDPYAIYEAFMATLKREIPEDVEKWPDWYKERMELCEKCEHNTENMENENLRLLSLSQKIIFKKQACSICNCFIKQKCWIESEICAREYIGKEAYWTKIRTD